jgi:hypothetical protein
MNTQAINQSNGSQGAQAGHAAFELLDLVADSSASISGNDNGLSIRPLEPPKSPCGHYLH